MGTNDVRTLRAATEPEARAGTAGRAPENGPPQTALLPRDFDAWFRDHRETVYRYVRFRVATRERAEDITSDVFLKALRALHRYDPGRSSPRTWLLRIARNCVTDHLRALRRRGSLHVSLDRAPDLASGAPSQEERILRQEQVNRLLNAVATLLEKDQEILSLRYGAGLRNTEIAATLDISCNVVAVRLHRALGRLRVAVDGGAAGEVK